MSCETMVIEHEDCQGACISKDRYYTKDDFDALLATKQDKLTKDDILGLLGLTEVDYDVTDCGGNTKYYKVLAKMGAITGLIPDDWDTIIANINNGTYTDRYAIGAYKPLNLGAEGTVNMQLVAVNADELSGGGYAKTTWISMELLATKQRFNPDRTPSSAPFNEGTGTIGGWDKSEIRDYVRNTIKPLIPSNVRSVIKNVIKYSGAYGTNGNVINDATSTDDVWIPSTREINDSIASETQSPIYSSIYTDNASRIKTIGGTAQLWWTRSANDGKQARMVYTSGSVGIWAVTATRGIALGFCI